MNTSIDYTADAPDFFAWAGDGPNATHIYATDDRDAITELAARYNRAVADLVDQGTDPADAMADLDVEALAADIEVQHEADCRYCDIPVHWTTAAWKPADTGAPYDERGNICCDACHALPVDERGEV
jgi:hypothetical protein